MSLRKIKVGDFVVVITGKERGRTGTVQSIGENNVTITGLNVKVLHKRGGIVTKEAPIHISNVLNYSEKLKKGCRTGVSVVGGQRVRTLKNSGEQLIERKIPSVRG